MTEIFKRFFNEDNRTYVIALVLTVLIFHITFGLQILVPTNITWLMDARHDWGQVYLGWSFWRNEAWTFPLGTMHKFIYPLGSNMGYTDCVPLMALLCKPFSAILPDEFQYVGIWLLFCYLMMAHYTYKICRLYTTNTIYIVAAIVIIVANPVFIYRGMHPALCAHGFILASIYNYLLPVTRENAARINRNQLLLAFIISIINPYLTAMVMVFNVALPLRHIIYNKVLTPLKGLMYFAGSVFSVIFVWIALGMLQFTGEKLSVAGGYGLYALNLNFLYNSSGFSKILPQLPWVSPMQYEGYMYLGFGGILLVIISLTVFLISQKPKAFAIRHKWLMPLFVISVLLFLFAITNKITLNDKVLVEIPLPEKILEMLGTFRSSGRFFWPVYYLLLLFVLIVFFRSRLPKWIIYSVLAVTILFQAYDVYPLYTMRKFSYGTYNSPLDEQKWDKILPGFTTMVTYPPFNNHLLNNMDYQDLCYMVLRHKMGITTGYSARDNGEAYKRITDSITSALFNDEISPKSIYVTTPSYIDVFGSLLHQKKLDVQYLDGYYILYSKNAAVPNVSNDELAKKHVDSIYNAYNKPPFLNKIATPVSTNDKIDFSVEEITIGKNSVFVKGWAYRKALSNNKGDEVYVTLSEGGTTSIVNTLQIKRTDLTTFFKKPYLDDSGFSAAFFGEGNWGADARLGLAIKGAEGTWTYADVGPLSLLNRKKKPDTLGTLPKAGKIIGNVDEFKQDKSMLHLSGWAAFEDSGSVDCLVKIAFIGESANYITGTAVVKRDDVTKALQNKFDYQNSGFNVESDISGLKKGTYKIGLVVSKPGREEMRVTDKTVTVE